MDFSKMTAEELLQYGIDVPNIPYAEDLVEELIKKSFNRKLGADGFLIFEAGKYWSDEVYSKDLLKALMVGQEYELLFRVFKEWQSDRYCAKELSLFLLRNAPFELIINKVEDFPDDCYDRTFLDVSLEILGDESFGLVAENWPKVKYDKSILEILVSYWHESLLLNQSEWPNIEGCNKIVVDELLGRGFMEDITWAIKLFEKKNYDERLFEAIIEDGSWDDFYNACSSTNVPYGTYMLPIMVDKAEADDIDDFFDFLDRYGTGRSNVEWPDNAFSKHIAQALFEMNCAEKLFEIGARWNGYVFTPDIGYCLFKLGNDEYIEKARKEWPKDRIKYVGKPKIFVEY